MYTYSYVDAASRKGYLMPQYVIVEAPSILGLRPAGVERLPEALKAAGLEEGLHASNAGSIHPLPYHAHRDPETHLLNGEAIRTYSQRLATALMPLLTSRQFPVVLGGDCSILIGTLLALRHLGRYGLFFLDGHADFYQPEADPHGEVASMELALVSGRGPTLLTDIDGLRPLVRDEDIVAFGLRDLILAAQEGSQDITQFPIEVYDLARVQSQGITASLMQGLQHLLKKDLVGFWIHLDADVLDDAMMPAVDYRLPGGLSFAVLSVVLQTLLTSGRAVGITITIFNPLLDLDGSIARQFVSSLLAGMRASV
jgi:arginase